MQRFPKIKICGLTLESDVDLAILLGADYFGFITYPKSPRSIRLERAIDLASRVPEGRRVMVDIMPSLSHLEAARVGGFDFFQIHTGSQIDLEMLQAYSDLVGSERLWISPRLVPGEPFPEQILELAQTILVDTYSVNQIGGTGKTGDWAQFSELCARYPEHQFILAGGLSPDNIMEAVRASGADHLDVNSGVEVSPGIKDTVKLHALFELLKRS